jgi:hypothetical protein
MICFTEVWFTKNLIPIEESTKAGLLYSFPLSNGHQDRRVFLLLCQQKTQVSVRPTTKIAIMVHLLKSALPNDLC